MATISTSGWPHVQHRGGPPGLLRVLDDRTLGFADFAGNRQYITIGNAAGNDRAALFLMDYPGRRRPKIFAQVEVRELADVPDLADALAVPGYKAEIERAMLVHLATFDWNCPQHITPRFTEAALPGVTAPVRDRLPALEAENDDLRERLDRGA